MNDNVIFRYKNGRIIPIKVDNLKSPNQYMNAKIRESKKVKKITKKEQLTNLNEKYKNKLMYPIQTTRVKKFWTGDQKTGKYDIQYHAKTKNGYDIYKYSVEELEEELKKDIYR